MIRPHLYFDNYTVNNFIDKNNRVKRMFVDTKIDKDMLWDKYKAEVEEEIQDIVFGPDDDPSIVYDIYLSKMDDLSDVFWQVVPMHTYQFISVLFHTFENQLTSYFNNEIKRYYSPTKIYSYGQVFELIKEKVGQENLSAVNKIDELRLLNNTIKHGNGSSADQLRILRPDYFKNDDILSFGNSDLLEDWNSVYENSMALNVKEENFYLYHESINRFWSSLPLRIYLDDLEPKYEIE